jgi:hypothetical protein
LYPAIDTSPLEILLCIKNPVIKCDRVRSLRIGNTMIELIHVVFNLSIIPDRIFSGSTIIHATALTEITMRSERMIFTKNER